MSYTKRVIMLLLCMVLFTVAAAAQSKNVETDQTGSAQAQNSTENSIGEETTEEGEELAPNDQVREEDLAIQDSDSPQVAIEGGLNQFGMWDFLRMFLVLGMVIAVIYAVFFVLKKLGNPRLQGNTLISIISTQNLQGNRALHLVEVGNEVFLIGSSEGGVELVGKIEDQETLDQVHLFRSEMMAGGRSFQSSLKEMFSRSSSAGGESEPEVSEEERSAGAALFLQKQRERLKNL